MYWAYESKHKSKGFLFFFGGRGGVWEPKTKVILGGVWIDKFGNSILSFHNS